MSVTKITKVENYYYSAEIDQYCKEKQSGFEQDTSLEIVWLAFFFSVLYYVK